MDTKKRLKELDKLIKTNSVDIQHAVYHHHYEYAASLRSQQLIYVEERDQLKKQLEDDNQGETE